MSDPLQGMTIDEIRELARKEYENVRKRRKYQNKWRRANKKKVAKYNQAYRDKVNMLKAGEHSVHM